MTTKIGKFKKHFLNSWTAAAAASFMLFSCQSAQAGGNHEDRISFREFRQQNLGIDRHSARRLFRAEKNLAGSDGARQARINANHTMTMGSDGVVRRVTPDVGNINKVKNNIMAVKRQSLQLNDSGVVRLRSGVDLDLTSSDRNITLGRNLFANVESVQISTGGETKTLGAGSQVSAAEYIAVKQVLLGGEQKVTIDGAGKAIGGEVDLAALTANNDVLRASSLVVSENVTTYGDFAKGSDFRLLGDLNNFGTVHALSSDQSVKGGAIRADDINNFAGARISSSVDLTLDAAGNLRNEGAISSDGNLTLSAGVGIYNGGNVGAKGDVNLVSPSVENSGVVSSNGNINLYGVSTSALTVNNTGGMLAALNGAINARASTYNGTFDTTVYGGDLLSRELNLSSGQGLATVNVGQLTGLVNQTGTAARVMAATEILNVGQVCLTGDPTYFNRLGSINIVANIIDGADLVFAAAGDILVSDGVTISTATPLGGFDITFIAGADFVATSGTDGENIPPLPTPGDISLSGKASKTGGGIIFGDLVLVNANSIGPLAGNAGDIYMYAFGGKKGTNAGIIDLSGATVTAVGSLLGANGDVVLVAGAKGGDSILSGTIVTGFGSGAAGGEIRMTTAQPVSSIKGEAVAYSAAGLRTSAAELVGATKLTKAGVVTVFGPGGGISTSGDLEIVSGAGISLQDNQIVTNANVSLTAAADITDSGGSTPLTAGGRIDLFSVKGNIGDDINFVSVDAPLISAHAGASSVFLSVPEPGGAVTIDSASARDAIFVIAAERTVSSNNDLSAGVVGINAFNLGVLNNIVASEQFELRTNDAAFTLTPANFNTVTTPSIVADVAGNIGTDANNPVFLPEGLRSAVVEGANNVFLTSIFDDAISFDITAMNTVDIQSFGPIELRRANITGGADPTLNVIAGLGTLSVTGDVSAEEGITLLNADPNKGKIAIGSNLSFQTFSTQIGTGNINISVGPAGPVAALPDNVVIGDNLGGTATFTGSGVKAKPVTTLNLRGANINVNNGLKQGNVRFGSGLVITAEDQPM